MRLTQQEGRIVLGHRGAKWQIEDCSPGLVSNKGLWFHEAEGKLSLDDSDLAGSERRWPGSFVAHRCKGHLIEDVSGRQKGPLSP